MPGLFLEGRGEEDGGTTDGLVHRLRPNESPLSLPSPARGEGEFRLDCSGLYGSFNGVGPDPAKPGVNPNDDSVSIIFACASGLSQAKGVYNWLIIQCPSLALQACTSDFPGIACILDGDRSGAVVVRRAVQEQLIEQRRLVAAAIQQVDHIVPMVAGVRTFPSRIWPGRPG